MARAERGRVGALAPWFGAKRSIADQIVRQLGPHRSYVEPFCGSMAVLLAKQPTAFETVNDLHRDLVNLARVVRDEDLSCRLHWKLRRTLCCEGLFRESLAVVRGSDAPGPDDGPSVERAYHYFLASWMGVNGVAGTGRYNTNFARRYSSGGGGNFNGLLSATESLPWWHDRLRRVAIYSACGIELCERVEDRSGTVLYVDPPYLVKGAKYEHDFRPEDHDRLAAALRRFKETRCVVSYYEHPDLDRLYPGWAKVRLKATKAMVQGAKGAATGAVAAPEVVLVNGPPVTDAGGVIFGATEDDDE